MKNWKRVLSLILVIALTVSFVPNITLGASAAAAEVGYAQKLLDDTSSEGINMSAEYATGQNAVVENVPSYAWRLSSQSIPNINDSQQSGQHLVFMLFRLSEEFQAKVAKAEGKATISVTYWDGFSEGTTSGHFGLSYNDGEPGSVNNTHTVFLKGENRWKTVDIELTDAVLKSIDVNGNKGFRLGSWAYYGPEHSESDIYISSVQVSCEVDGVTHTVSRALNSSARDGEGIQEVLYNSGSAYNAVGLTEMSTPAWEVERASQTLAAWQLRGNAFSATSGCGVVLLQSDLTSEFVTNMQSENFDNKLTVTMTYWDGKEESPDADGYIGVQYRNTGGAHPNHKLALNGTQQWVTKTFTLTDFSGTPIGNNGNSFLKINGYDSANYAYIHSISYSYEVNGTTYTASKTFDTTARDDGTNISLAVASEGGQINVVSKSDTPKLSAWQLRGNAFSATSGCGVVLLQSDLTSEFVTNMQSESFNNKLTVTMTYWDGKEESPDAAGYIGVQYRNTSGAHPNYKLTLNGTQRWVTKTFTLTDFSGTPIGNNGNSFLKINGYDSANYAYIHSISYSYEVNGTTYTASKTFDSTARDDGTNISLAVATEGGQINVVEKEAAESGDLLQVTLDESFRNYLPSETQISVTYFDGQDGLFALLYNNGTENVQKVIQLNNSGVWKVHTFKLNDADFTDWNGTGASFALTTCPDGMVGSNAGVYISDITVKPADVELSVSSVSDKIGNIFYGTQVFDFSCEIDATANTTYDLAWEVLDRNNDIVDSSNVEFTADENGKYTANLDLSGVTAYGIYTLNVSIADARGVVASDSLYFSRAVDAIRSMDDFFGMTVHLNSKPDNITSSIKVLEDAKIAFIRDDYYWDEAETTKGTVVVPEAWFIKAALAEEAGIATLAVLGANNANVNGFYSGFDSEGPANAEWIAAYANYCGEVAEQMKNAGYAGGYYQIWNEWNLESFMVAPYNTVEYYIPVFNAAAAAIKEADPTAKIVLGSVSYGEKGNNGPKGYLNKLLSNAAVLEAIDVVSYHKYYMNTLAPEETNLVDAINEVDEMLNAACTANSISKDIKIWITETGKSTATGCNSEATQAAHMLRIYVWALSTGNVDKVVWYDLMDDGYDPANSEHHFGTVHYAADDVTPYAAKQSYIAMCAMQNRLGGACYTSELNVGEGAYAHQFQTADGRNMYVVWSDDDTTKNVALDISDVIVYDMFGNVVEGAVSGGVITANEEPVYIVENAYGSVTWQHEDGTVLEVDEDLAYEVVPSYDGETPTKASDAQYNYVFDGWTPAVVPVSGDAIYTAHFAPVTQTYTVIWKNYNGDVLETDTVEYGAVPAFNANTPVKVSDETYNYTFTGWSPEISAVVGEVIYVAQFEANEKNPFYAQKVFNDSSAEGKNVTVSYGGDAAAQVDTVINKAYRLSGRTDIANANGEVGTPWLRTLYLRVDSTYQGYVAAAGNKVKVAITYWDGFSEGTDSGFFAFQYAIDSSTVGYMGNHALTGKNEWKTVTYELTNAALQNCSRLNNKCMMLTVNSGGYSASDVYISKVEVTCEVDGVTYSAYKYLNDANAGGVGGLDEAMYEYGGAYRAVGLTELEEPAWIIDPGAESLSAWQIRGNKFTADSGCGVVLLQSDLTSDFVTNMQSEDFDNKLTVTMTYWDGKEESADADGYIGVQYRNTGGAHPNHKLALNGTQRWVTQTFTLTDFSGTPIGNNGNSFLKINGYDSANYAYIHSISYSYEVNGTTYTASKTFDTTARDDGTNISLAVATEGGQINVVSKGNTPKLSAWQLRGNAFSATSGCGVVLLQSDLTSEFVTKMQSESFNNKLTVTMTYWDGKEESPDAAGYIGVQYRNTGGAHPNYKLALNGTQQWVTQTFTITDFSGTPIGNNGNSFLKVNGYDSYNYVYIHSISYSYEVDGTTYTASKTFDTAARDDGTNITLAVATEGGQINVVSKGDIVKDRLEFTLNENLCDAMTDRVAIHVTYWDEGTDSFALSYNGVNGVVENVVQRTNTNTWQKKTFIVSGSDLANTNKNGSNFMLTTCLADGTRFDKALVVGEVYVELETYNVTWNVNGVITTEAYVVGQTPAYKGSTTKAPDAEGYYVFTGWDTDLAPVTQDVTYTAQYDVYADLESTIVEWGVVLKDNIGLKFIVKCATTKFFVNGELVETTVTENSDGTFTVSLELAAAQMTDVITVTVDGMEVDKSYSVRAYADYILANNYPEKTKALVKAMLDYGGKSQIYFGYNVGKLANNGIVLDTYPTPENNSQTAIVSGNAEGIRFYGASVLATTKTQVRFYFSLTGDISEYTFTVGGQTLNPVEKDGLYYVTVDGLSPDKLNNDIAVQVNDTMTVTYSAMTYIQRMYNKESSSAELIAFVQALYAYHLAALEYVAV